MSACFEDNPDKSECSRMPMLMFYSKLRFASLPTEDYGIISDSTITESVSFPSL